MTADVIDRSAVARGAAVGLLILVPLSAIRVALDRNIDDFDSSGWAPLFVIALFAVYVIAGRIAGRAAGDAPLTNGILAAVGAFVLWVPIRIVIWAVRDTDQSLFGGEDPVFTAASLLGALVFAAAFGAFGGWLASRRSREPGSVDA